MTTWMKNASAALMLVMVANTQPVLAETSYVAEAPPVITTVEAPQPVYVPTVQEVLIAVCKARGYGQDCAQTLLGMLWTESSNVSTAIGDSGRARGYFQIHYKLHNITTDCAEDLVCSANWTIDYLERNGYPHYVTYAIQCHNGCNAANGYTGKVYRYGAYFWNQPLELKQAATVDLSQLVTEPEVEMAMK